MQVTFPKIGNDHVLTLLAKGLAILAGATVSLLLATSPGAAEAPSSAPWQQPSISEADVPAELLKEWRSSVNSESCALLVAPSMRPGHKVGLLASHLMKTRVRSLSGIGGWILAFGDLSPMTTCKSAGDSYGCFDSLHDYSQVGIMGVPSNASLNLPSSDPEQTRWGESEMLVTSDEHWAVAKIQIEGQDCHYLLWSTSGRERLLALVQELRLVSREVPEVPEVRTEVASSPVAPHHVPQAATTQFNISLVVGGTMAMRDNPDRDLHLSYGLRPEVIFGRSSQRDLGVGPFVELLRIASADFTTGIGGTLVIPVGRSRALAPSLGVYYQDSDVAEPGVSAGLAYGFRQFNSVTSFDGTFGLRLDGRYGFGDHRQRSITLSLQADLTLAVAIAAMAL